MAENENATPGLLPFDAALFEDVAVNYKQATRYMMYQYHFAMARIDAALQAGGLYMSAGKPSKTPGTIMLPWGYGFSRSHPTPDGVTYNLSWGDNNRQVIQTSVVKNVFLPYYDAWALITLEEDIRSGFLDQVAEFTCATETERRDILDSGHPNCYKEIDMFVSDTQEGPKRIEADRFSHSLFSLN